jgi:hypothetical protein
MAVSVLPLLARMALLVTAVGVIVCCLHIRRAHDAEPGRGAFALLGFATVAVVAVGALTDDLALTAIADLALLLGVTGPTVLASSARG